MSGLPENGGQGQEKMYASSESGLARDAMLAAVGGESKEQQHICFQPHKDVVLTFGDVRWQQRNLHKRFNKRSLVISLKG